MLIGSEGTVVEPVCMIIMGRCLKSRFHHKHKGDRSLWSLTWALAFPNARSRSRGTYPTDLRPLKNGNPVFLVLIGKVLLC